MEIKGNSHRQERMSDRRFSAVFLETPLPKAIINLKTETSSP